MPLKYFDSLSEGIS